MSKKSPNKAYQCKADGGCPEKRLTENDNLALDILGRDNPKEGRVPRGVKSSQPVEIGEKLSHEAGRSPAPPIMDVLSGDTPRYIIWRILFATRDLQRCQMRHRHVLLCRLL